VQLQNGDEIFPAMLKEIRAAQKTITLESFIWSSGKVSTQFVEALSERARGRSQSPYCRRYIGGFEIEKS